MGTALPSFITVNCSIAMYYCTSIICNKMEISSMKNGGIRALSYFTAIVLVGWFKDCVQVSLNFVQGNTVK